MFIYIYIYIFWSPKQQGTRNNDFRIFVLGPESEFPFLLQGGGYQQQRQGPKEQRRDNLKPKNHFQRTHPALLPFACIVVLLQQTLTLTLRSYKYRWQGGEVCIAGRTILSVTIHRKGGNRFLLML